MIKPLILFAVTFAFLWVAKRIFGYWPTYQVSYGAFSIVAAVIALTFFWLWARRSTPLALGMAFGWVGAASVMGWWWLYNLLGKPAVMSESVVLFVFLSVYFVGAVMHLELIGRSFGVSRVTALLPVGFAIFASLVLTLLF